MISSGVRLRPDTVALTLNFSISGAKIPMASPSSNPLSVDFVVKSLPAAVKTTVRSWRSSFTSAGVVASRRQEQSPRAMMLSDIATISFLIISRLSWWR